MLGNPSSAIGLAERLNKPKARQKGDFLDNILNAKNPDGSSITLDEVKTECFVLMVAASDTTEAFFCGFVRYVLQMPEIDDYDRRGLLTRPVPLYDEIKDMPYLTACYKETMRYQPSTPMIIPRYVSVTTAMTSGQNGGWSIHSGTP